MATKQKKEIDTNDEEGSVSEALPFNINGMTLNLKDRFVKLLNLVNDWIPREIPSDAVLINYPLPKKIDFFVKTTES